jgi:hypothetical protein
MREAWLATLSSVNVIGASPEWNDFVRLFHEHHIPNSVMKLKRQEFMSL